MATAPASQNKYEFKCGGNTLTPCRGPCLRAHDASFHLGHSHPFLTLCCPLTLGTSQNQSQSSQILHPGHLVCNYLQKRITTALCPTISAYTITKPYQTTNKNSKPSNLKTDLTIMAGLVVTGWSTLLAILAWWRLPIRTSSLGRVCRRWLLLLLALLRIATLLLAITCLLGLVPRLLLAIG